MKTIFIPLSDEELKLLQGLASVILARNLGMGGRETQKELTGREQLEDKITVHSSSSLSLFPLHDELQLVIAGDHGDLGTSLLLQAVYAEPEG